MIRTEARNNDPATHPALRRIADDQIGDTCAEALVLIKKAKLVGLAVANGFGAGDLVLAPKAAAQRWLREKAPTDPLHSRLTHFSDGPLLVLGDYFQRGQRS